jgi:transcription-repair coupling factor (superfamily II helicase)
VRRAVQDLAKELLELYAAREALPGHAFSPDTPWQHELEASFPYVETPDQLAAMREVKLDMERPRPMDRLVCGDVGYGKTEVAVRAAFKAVADGAQVAVLVPTTVLAQQHFQTFSRRLAAFPVRVEMLSRFRSEREQREIVQGLADGSIDIVIGTHRLLQKDVRFKNLGLVIVDEEQRFGVAHKERLKQMRREVDVLTLTATPIPRTLHMALSGIRDMSTIETPPEDRLPIKTYVTQFDERVVREAIIREIERGGQVYFVHNRVHNIEQVARKVRELVPEAEVLVAHGQMPEEQLERTMLRFVAGDADVLVCTTIIESGLDIPNVNTIIINQADRLGLSQLYQLRGRVGRGAVRAYAYLLYDRGRALSEAAQKRLQAIFEATELGAGFQIAMRDLEIRGAGNLLGAEQSGHIAAVGFDLYVRMLGEAVRRLQAVQRGEQPEPGDAQRPPVILDLPVSAFIPESYVPDLNVRLSVYQRMGEARTPEEVRALEEELKDRFGPPPRPVCELLFALTVRALARQARATAIQTEDGALVLRMEEGVDLRAAGLAPAPGLAVGHRMARLDLRVLGERWREALVQALERLAGAAVSAA